MANDSDDDLAGGPEVEPLNDGSGLWLTDVVSRNLSHMELFEGVAFVSLVALSFRVVASIVSVIMTISTAETYPQFSSQLGNVLSYLGGFGNVTGILFTLGLLALLWWRVSYWSSVLAGADEVEREKPIFQLQRLDWMSRWTRVIFALTTAASIAIVVSVFLLTEPGQWNLGITEIAFQIAYTAILLCGLVVCWRLCNDVEAVAGFDE